MQWYKEIKNVTWQATFLNEAAYDDIALVEVMTSFEWSRAVKPACLPFPMKLRPNFTYGGSLLVSAKGLKKKLFFRYDAWTTTRCSC